MGRSTARCSLRARRARQGLTQAGVARAAGTSPSNLSAYETGSKTPNESTRDRIEALLEAGHNSPIFRHELMTTPRASAAIRRLLRAGVQTPAQLLRPVAEMVAHAEHLRSPADVAAFLASPSTTGDRRWDALLAGVVERLALQRGWEPPEWTAGGFLDTCWFVGTNPELHAYAFARSPASLHARGIMLDPADLASV